MERIYKACVVREALSDKALCDLSLALLLISVITAVIGWTSAVMWFRKHSPRMEACDRMLRHGRHSTSTNQHLSYGLSILNSSMQVPQHLRRNPGLYSG